MKKSVVSMSFLAVAMCVSTWAVAGDCGGPGQISCNIQAENLKAHQASDARMEELRRQNREATAQQNAAQNSYHPQQGGGERTAPK